MTLKSVDLRASSHARGFMIWASVALMVLVFIPYAQVLRHGFTVMDDLEYVSANLVVQEGLTVDGVVWAFEGAHSSNWHPLTWLSHMADCELFGLNAGGHHAVNVLLHAANAVLLFVALQMMTGAMWRSLAVAMIFALHPQRVESVAWVSERKDVLSGLFWMLALIAYAWYAARPGWKRYGCVAGAMALGLMSKSMLVTLPFVLLLLDVWPLRRGALPWVNDLETKENSEGPDFAPRGWTWLVAEKVPLLGLAVSASVVAMMSQRAESITDFDQVGLAVRVANALVSAVAYLRQMIWPMDLVPFYPHPMEVVARDEWWKELYLPAIGAGLLLLAVTLAVLGGAFRARKRMPWLAVGWFWYLGTLVPVIGIILIGLQARADRYTYLPMIGVGIMLAWGAGEWVRRRPGVKKFVPAGAAAVLAGWVVLSWIQVSYWRTDERLFGRAVEVTENNFFAYNELGLAAEESGEMARAVEYYLNAISIFPRFDMAHNNLGLSYMALGEFELAEAHLKRAIEIGFSKAIGLQNLFVLYRKQERFAEAEECLKEVLRMKPDNLTAEMMLGLMYAQLGRLAEAEAAYLHALELDSDNLVALNNLGAVYVRRGDYKKAIVNYQRALELDPGNEMAKKNLEAVPAQP